MRDLLILGGGFIGGRLAARHPEAVVTRRSPGPGTVRFDLADEGTWRALPPALKVVWTFPAVPPETAVRFRREVLGNVEALIVLGSTSAFLVPAEDALVDETTPLDLAQPRVAGEEALRASGATVLYLAGLWGGERDPLRWVTQGRIRNGARFVNLVHADDVIATVEAVLARPCPGERFVVSDGAPRRWREHVSALVAEGRLPEDFSLPESAPGTGSKRVSNERLRGLLPAGHAFRHFT